MRLAVFTDYPYRYEAGTLYAERAFALFLGSLGEHFERFVLIGRSAGEDVKAHYALPAGIEFAPLRHYASLARPASGLWALVLSLRQMWRALDGIDVLWVLGPQPHAIMLVALGRLRRRVVVLGVRQDWPSYVKRRHPQRRALHLVAVLMEATWRGFAWRLPVVAVGPELSARYNHAPAVLDLVVSLVPAAAVLDSAPRRDYGPALRILSVGRLDEEKNPLLLANIFALLRDWDRGWQLVVCGEGALRTALEQRLAQLGVADHAELRGYVPVGAELFELYRSSHALLHVSWTEGFPQVLAEAFASGLPVVATAVGGVPAAAGAAALLIPPGDAPSAAEALRAIADDPALRNRLIAEGLRRAQGMTLESQIGRLSAFLKLAGSRRS